MEEQLTEEEKGKIVEALKKRGATLECPRCKKDKFAVLDGYIVNTLQAHYRGLVYGGKTLPTAIIVCQNCGFLSQHALGSIGLLEKE